MFYKKIISYSGKKYLYSPSMNKFIQTSEPLFEVIDSASSLSKAELLNKYFMKFDSQLIEDCLSTIDKFKHLGFFENISPHKYNYVWNEEEVNEIISSRMNSITLGITEQCNFRCKYCIYSGSFENQRIHSFKKMSLSTAKKSVEYLLDHSQKQTLPRVVCFYGGEPLLHWDLIHSIIQEYGNQNNTLQYSITTNGSLLNKEIIEFLIDNNVTLIISLDGSKEIHDRNRVLNETGKGSFDTVWGNIQMIRELSEEYYKTLLICNAVLSPPIDYSILKSFFSENKLTCMTHWVEYYGSDLVQNIKSADVKGWEKIKKEYYESYTQGVTKKEGEQFVYDLFDSFMKRIHHRDLSPLDGSNIIRRMICIPSARKLFVDATGNLSVCEKIDGNENMQIGTIDTGVDVKKVLDVMKQFKEIQSIDCYDCWLIRLCDLCHIHVVNNNNVDIAKKQFNCKLAKSFYEELLQLYVSILERNSNAFDHLKIEKTGVRLL
ncbi:MAG: radical SAM protein [Clostridia bacterium]|nr:radical SAM protein [Clostridia bacterium]MDD4048202.1 radical SAM protein [Clostridia bacterium]